MKNKNNTSLTGNFTQIANELIRSTNLNSDEKIIFIILSSFNPSFPSISKLCDLTGWGNKKTIKVLHSLESKNLIHIERKTGKSNLYIIDKDYVTSVKNTPVTSVIVTPTSVLKTLPPVSTEHSNNTNIIISKNNTNNNTKAVAIVTENIFLKEEDDMNTKQTSTVELGSSTDILKSCITPSTNNVVVAFEDNNKDYEPSISGRGTGECHYGQLTKVSKDIYCNLKNKNGISFIQLLENQPMVISNDILNCEVNSLFEATTITGKTYDEINTSDILTIRNIQRQKYEDEDYEDSGITEEDCCILELQA